MLLNSKNPFALIRLPKDNKVYFIQEEPGENIYFFNSFTGNKKHQFRFKYLTSISLKDIHAEKVPLSARMESEVTSYDAYISLLEKTISFLKKEEANKIVISRTKWVDKEEVNPIHSFFKLCERYPLSFCHLSFWNQEEVWLGATPEVLGTYTKGEFQTMSLAGTLPESAEWSDKEFEEQDIVTEYIKEKLQEYSTNIYFDGPKNLHLGHIKHLVTYFTSEMNEKYISRLINELHPTPAVCGLPLEVSKQYIMTEEGYNRDFYSGYIGLITPESQKYFVNLRCGKLYNNGALIFVGGGITAQSNPEKEWEETELKSRFISECL